MNKIKLALSLDNQDWYRYLVEECNSIIVESVFASRWTLIEGYHELGQRIIAEKENFKRENLSQENIIGVIAESLGKSPRTIYRAVQFYKQYPMLSDLPDGKNISWGKIVNQYLPAQTEASQKSRERKKKIHEKAEEKVQELFQISNDYIQVGDSKIDKEVFLEMCRIFIATSR